MAISAETKFKGGRTNEETIARAYEFAPLDRYTFRERLLIRAADILFFVLINLIGRTLRFEVENWENWIATNCDGRQGILTFWHNRVLAGTYYFRDRGIVVMTSQSFDGEYIARFIQRFGYGAVRGSSTRGATGAMVEMARLMRAGKLAALTIDGPKGPRYVAKMGAVMLAKQTGFPVLPFTLNSDKYWEIPSWDRLQIPYPFTRTRVIIGEPISIPAHASDELLNQKRDEVQRALDALSVR